MRFVTAQLNAYVTDDVWLRNAEHANNTAHRLSAGLTRLGAVELAYPTQANEIFVRIPPDITWAVEADGFTVNQDELDGTAARFVTGWNTQTEEVDQLLACLSRHCAALEKKGV